MAIITDDGHGSDRAIRLDGLTHADRRRPDRLPYTNPALIGLLRGTCPAAPAPAPDLDEELSVKATDEPGAARRDDLAAARGIGRSAATGFILWALVLLAIRAVWLA